MSNTKTLHEGEAIEKIKELAEGNICLMGTYEDGKIVSRPMSTLKIDMEGDAWFFSREGSDKNTQIENKSTVHLMYMDTSKNHYLSLSGVATIVKDSQKAKELWTPLAKAWFEEGPDDPSLTLIKVSPDEGHFWDTKNGKLVSMLKIAVAALTGNEMDGGIEGDLKIRH